MVLTHSNRKMKALELLLLNSEQGAGAVGVFDLPAGHTCPAAKDCKSMAIEGADGSWTIQDCGIFRCYAASTEVMYKATRDLRHRNWADLKKADNMEEELAKMVEFSPYKYIRLHSSGDFYTIAYMNAWIGVALRFPNRVFYGYTKMAHLASFDLPDNFRFNLSLGGIFDKEIMAQSKLPFAGVAIDPKADYDAPIIAGALTELAVLRRQSFYIPIHGTQPKGTRESKAVSWWKKEEANHSF